MRLLWLFFCHKAVRINTTLQDAGGRQQKKIGRMQGKAYLCIPKGMLAASLYTRKDTTIWTKKSRT